MTTPNLPEVHLQAALLHLEKAARALARAQAILLDVGLTSSDDCLALIDLKIAAAVTRLHRESDGPASGVDHDACEICAEPKP